MRPDTLRPAVGKLAAASIASPVPLIGVVSAPRFLMTSPRAIDVATSADIPGVFLRICVARRLIRFSSVCVKSAILLVTVVPLSGASSM